MFTLININLIILTLIAFANTFIALVIFLQGSKKQADIYFSLGALSAGLWVWVGIIRYYVYLQYGSAIEPYLFTKFSTLFALSIFFFFCFFTFSFLEKKLRLSFIESGVLILVYVVTVFLIFFSNSILISEEFLSYAIQPAYNWGSAYYYIYIPVMLFFFSIGLIKLTISFIKARNKSLERSQLGLTLLGTGLAGALGITFGLLVASLPNLVNVFWVGRLSTLFFTGFIAYAILKHSLFNIKVVATELLTFAIWIFLLIRALLSATPEDRIINWVLFVVIIIAGILLIRSVLREVRAREHIEVLADNLEKANSRLRELDKLKSQFLSIASHDLRAPLTAIRNFMSILLEGTYGKLPAAAEEGTRQVFERATEMADMVDNYLNVSRIEQGRMKYDFADIDLKETLNEAVKAFAPVAKEKGLALNYTPIPEPLFVRGDEPKLREVFENLIVNAINYTPKGSVTLAVHKKPMKVMVTITDTGIGMTKETISKLFGLFSPGNDSRTYNPKSTGVGLYITKAHITAHKGTVRAESDGKGKGSRFIVELPLSET